MVLQRKNKQKYPKSLDGDFNMFVVDWHNEDVEPEDDEISNDSQRSSRWQPNRDQFTIKAFGLDADGNSIALTINDFKPYFFIKVPDNWNKAIAAVFMEGLRQKIAKTYRDSLCDWSLIKAKPFYYFTGDKRFKFKFIKLKFDSYVAFKKYEYILRDKIRIAGLNKSKPYLYERYESNILPTLRFIHERNLNAAGWLHLKKGKFYREYNDTTCQLHLTCSYKDVHKSDNDEVPPINYLSYDIEADSSHGDFPIADKNYQKLARDLITEYNRVSFEEKKQNIQCRQECQLEKSQDKTKLIKRLLELAFNPYYNNNRIRSVKPLNRDEIPDREFFEELSTHVLEIYRDTTIDRDDKQEQLLELLISNLPELEEDDEMDYYSLADQFLTELARLTRSNNVIFQRQPEQVTTTLLELAFDPYYDNNDVNVVYPVANATLPSTSTLSNISPSIRLICERCFKHISDEKRYGRKKIKFGEKRVTLDNFVEELTALLDHHFPKLKGDPIIQIGSIFKRYGDKHPFLKHIITLDTCSDITNERLVADENKDIFIPDKDLAKELCQHNPSKYVHSDIDPKDAADHLAKKLKQMPKDERELFNLEGLEYRKQKQLKEDNAEVIVERYKTEAEVLKAWVRLVREADPDLIVGYNIFGFDFKYMYGRAKVLGVEDEFSKLGRIDWFQGRGGTRDETVLKEQKLSSSGLGDNTLYYLYMFGRVSIDLYKVAQKSFSLESYKLDFVCKKYLGKSKNDVPPSEIFIKQKGTADDRRMIAEYCLIDCVLVTRFLDKLEILINNIGMANVCNVPFSYLFLRGQGIKLLSFVSKICRSKGYLIIVLNKDDNGENDESYEGAVVLYPYKDIYFVPVVVADFNSLYPSCMISENLSHDSYVGSKIVSLSEAKAYDTDSDDFRQMLRGKNFNDNNPFEKLLLDGELEGWDYVDIPFELYEYVPVAAGRKKLKKVVKEYKFCRFAQPPDGEKSIVPTILKELLTARASTRKEQKKFPKGSFKWNVREGLQLAYKVTANSLYGQIGARTSAIFLMDIAACTTSTGRNLIKKSKKFCEANYSDTRVVYGDSVVEDTPILVRYRGKKTIRKISDLSETYKQYHQEKEAAVLTEYEVWTDSGWTKINRVIRHKTHKKIYRVLTHTGCVDVTEDHSLIKPTGQKLKPSECTIGTELMHTALPQHIQLNKKPNVITKDEAWCMGFFMADGSCGAYNSEKYGMKYSWAINNKNLDYLTEAMKKLKDTYNQDFVINQTLESSGVYKLVPKGKIKPMVEKYRVLLYYRNSKEKIVPDIILEGSPLIQRAFWKGYYIGDGDKDKNGYTRCDCKNKVTALTLFQLMRNIGYNVSINTRKDKPNIYRLTGTTATPRKNTIAIKKLYDVTSEYSGQFVYDLETENHHFHAGVGNMIVHNTDSIFVKFSPRNRYGKQLKGLDAIYKSIELCIESSTAISRLLKRPHNLEFEKAIWPFILVSKKRYHGHYYTKYGDPSYYANSMGIVLKRRDNAPIVKHIFGGMTDIIMTKHDINLAIEFIKQECKKLLDGEFDQNMFIITKTLRSYYKNPDQIAHNVLAQRIGKRDPGNKPQGNDRIPYAYIRVKDNKCLQGDRIETPEFITANKMPLDYRFYLTNQIMKPVGQILELVLKNSDNVFRDIIQDYDNALIGVQKITNKKFAHLFKIKRNVGKSALELHLQYKSEQDKTVTHVFEDEELMDLDNEEEEEEEEEDEV